MIVTNDWGGVQPGGYAAATCDAPACDGREGGHGWLYVELYVEGGVEKGKSVDASMRRLVRAEMAAMGWATEGDGVVERHVCAVCSTHDDIPF